MKSNKKKRLCVYCGSGAGTDPRFKAAAAKLGRDMAEAGIDLVYGGGGNGLMGTVAAAVQRSWRPHHRHHSGLAPGA